MVSPWFEFALEKLGYMASQTARLTYHMISRSSKGNRFQSFSALETLRREAILIQFFPMKFHWVIARAVFVLAAVAVGSAGAVPQHLNAGPNSGALRFGQSIALSDFDSDGLVDEARLDGFGLHKRIRVRLSDSGKHVSLHFAAGWIEHGSLFARDLDQDGTADLVWTDLLHRESMIVWLGDGRGRFTRSAGLNGDEVAVGDNQFTAPAEPDRETAINSENEQTSDQPPAERCIHRDAPQLCNEVSKNRVPSSPTLDRPADRGPPVLHS